MQRPVQDGTRDEDRREFVGHRRDVRPEAGGRPIVTRSAGGSGDPRSRLEWGDPDCNEGFTRPYLSQVSVVQRNDMAEILGSRGTDQAGRKRHLLVERGQVFSARKDSGPQRDGTKGSMN